MGSFVSLKENFSPAMKTCYTIGTKQAALCAGMAGFMEWHNTGGGGGWTDATGNATSAGSCHTTYHNRFNRECYKCWVLSHHLPQQMQQGMLQVLGLVTPPTTTNATGNATSAGSCHTTYHNRCNRECYKCWVLSHHLPQPHATGNATSAGSCHTTYHNRCNRECYKCWVLSHHLPQPHATGNATSAGSCHTTYHNRCNAVGNFLHSAMTTIWGW